MKESRVEGLIQEADELTAIFVASGRTAKANLWKKIMKIDKLEVVAQIIAGQSPPSKFYNDQGIGLPFFQGKADFGELHPKVRLWCSSPKKVAEPGDILISVRAPVGPTNIADQTCCIGRGLSAIRAKHNLDNKFLIHYLRFIEPRLSGKGRGSTFSAITQSELRNLRIPLPPLAEQKRIAAILDKADALRAKRRHALATLDRLVQSVFLEMFGDPVTNPMGWETQSVESLIDNGPQNGLYRPSTDYGSGIPIIRIDSFYNGDIQDMNRLKRVRLDDQAIRKYSVSSNDVLINRVNSREYLGKSALVPLLSESTVFESNMMRFGVKKHLINPRYLVT